MPRYEMQPSNHHDLPAKHVWSFQVVCKS